jgi:Undecaprenyl-phosphate galactose phosphotransferase WbaP
MPRYEPLVALATPEGVETADLGAFARHQPWLGQRRLIHVILRFAVLFSSDVTALLMSATLGYLIWARIFLHQPVSLYIGLSPLFCLFPLSYAAAGLYPGFGLGAIETVKRLSHSTTVSFLVLAAASFAFKADPRYSRLTFAVTWLGALLFVPIFRALTLSVARSRRWWREPTVIVGTGPQIQLTIRSLSDGLSLGYEVVGALCSDRGSVGQSIGNVRVLGGMEVVPYLAKRGVTTILVWDSPSRVSDMVCIQQQVEHVIFIREENLLPVEQVRVRNLGGVLGIEFTNELLRHRNQLIKRTIDITVGTVCLLGALPVIAICGLLIKLISPGSVFFCQEREGLYGRKFTVWKLRTMYSDAEARLADILARNPDLRRQWEHCVKLPRDPRLLPVIGSLFRRFSLDELPQLWNVIAGEMSLVGPRPLPEYHLHMLSTECKRLRSAVRPGLTGMWQVMVRGDGSVDDQERFDTYYIRNWSLWLDMYILARTVSAVVTQRGAY